MIVRVAGRRLRVEIQHGTYQRTVPQRRNERKKMSLVSHRLHSSFYSFTHSAPHSLSFSHRKLRLAMTTSDTPAAVPAVKRLKTLSLEVPSFEVGPEGVPIFYGTDESPVNIRGRVVFHTQHECKGSHVLVFFSAFENVEWRGW